MTTLDRRSYHAREQTSLRNAKERSYCDKACVVLDKSETHSNDTPKRCQKRQPQLWGSFLQHEITRQFTGKLVSFGCRAGPSDSNRLPADIGEIEHRQTDVVLMIGDL